MIKQIWHPSVKNVYEFVTRHFVACVYQKMQKEVSQLCEFQVANDFFKLSGLIIHSRGYLDVYKYDKWGDKALLLERHLFLHRLY